MQHFILSVLALLLLPMTILVHGLQGTGTGIPTIPTITGAPYKNTTTYTFPSRTALPIPVTSKFTWISTQTKESVKVGPTASPSPSVYRIKRDTREHAREF